MKKSQKNHNKLKMKLKKKLKKIKTQITLPHPKIQNHTQIPKYHTHPILCVIIIFVSLLFSLSLFISLHFSLPSSLSLSLCLCLYLSVCLNQNKIKITHILNIFICSILKQNFTTFYSSKISSTM